LEVQQYTEEGEEIKIKEQAQIQKKLVGGRGRKRHIKSTCK
jgi:hypothetical protein